jgi:hypothetical protein
LLMLSGYCLSFGSYGLSTWITKLFQSVGMSNPFANAFLFAGANLPGNVVRYVLLVCRCVSLVLTNICALRYGQPLPN